jgi:thymidylate synthase
MVQDRVGFVQQLNPEMQYLDLLRRLRDEGDARIDRTGVGTRALFGVSLTFDLADGVVPLLTTKRIFWKAALRELLWFLSGETNLRPLLENGVHIWTDWPLARFRATTGEALDRDAFEARILSDPDFAAEWGELGPVYGSQWRRWPRFVDSGAVDSTGETLYRRDPTGIDQIGRLMGEIETNPTSRRLLFTGWNVAELDRMALPPCHMTYQYFVAGGRLDGLLFQRSCDVGLGLPFNLFEAAVLIHLFAHQTGLKPGRLTWMGGDTHLYANHEALVEEQLKREPRPFPKLSIRARRSSIDDYVFEDFEIVGYDPHPHIPAPIAV